MIAVEDWDLKNRLSGDEIVEMLQDVGHDKKSAKRALDEHLRKKSKDMKFQTKLV